MVCECGGESESESEAESESGEKEGGEKEGRRTKRNERKTERTKESEHCLHKEGSSRTDRRVASRPGAISRLLSFSLCVLACLLSCPITWHPPKSQKLFFFFLPSFSTGRPVVFPSSQRRVVVKCPLLLGTHAAHVKYCFHSLYLITIVSCLAAVPALSTWRSLTHTVSSTASPEPKCLDHPLCLHRFHVIFGIQFLLTETSESVLFFMNLPIF